MRRVSGAIAGIAAVIVLAGCSGTAAPAPTIPDGIDVGRSITYADVDGETLQLDACIPSARSEGPFPAVVLVHGGAFREGDRSNMLPLCEAFAGEGTAAFAIDYRLLPAAYPSQVDDTIAAVEWLREDAQVDRFDIDPSALSLLGSSAGGIIVLSAADRLGAEGVPPASVVTLSAAGDLTASGRELGDPDPALEKVVLGYLGCDEVESCATARDASPLYNVANLPPTLLVHGSDELIPLAQAEALESAISAAGRSVQLDIVDGAKHGLQLLDPATRDRISEFLSANSSP